MRVKRGVEYHCSICSLQGGKGLEEFDGLALLTRQI